MFDWRKLLSLALLISVSQFTSAQGALLLPTISDLVLFDEVSKSTIWRVVPRMPEDVAVGPDGLIYIPSRMGYSRIERRDARTGAAVDLFAEDDVGELAPTQVALQAGGPVFVYSLGGWIGRFDPATGQKLGMSRYIGADDVHNMEISAQGVPVVVSFAVRILALHSEDMADWQLLDTSMLTPRLIASSRGPDGDLYFADWTGNIARYDAQSLAFKEFFEITGLMPRFEKFTVGSDGDIYLYGTNSEGALIARYRPSTGAVVDRFALPGITIPGDWPLLYVEVPEPTSVALTAMGLAVIGGCSVWRSARRRPARRTQ